MKPIAYDRLVAYDEELAGRIRAQVGADPAVSEKRMFGGLAFLVGGNMAVAASSARAARSCASTLPVRSPGGIDARLRQAAR